MSLHPPEHPPAYSAAADGKLKLPSLPSRDASSPSHHIPLPTLEPQPTVEPARSLSPVSQRDMSTGASAFEPLKLPPLPADGMRSYNSPTVGVGALTIDDRSRQRDTSVSMEDPDDRMAAEALCGLHKVDTLPARTPSGYEQPLKFYPFQAPPPSTNDGSPEPLLSLLTSSHPWLGGTINGSLTAYSTTKSHSPRFIQSSADFLERRIGSPVANTVGSVSRRTGVDGSLRRYLGASRPNDIDRIDPELLSEEGASKRRKLDVPAEEQMEIENPLQRTGSGQSSTDTLPVYDNNSSPPYDESQDVVVPSEQKSKAFFRSLANRSWSTQLMITTSGLGAALNEASLRSLKFCLTLLKNANAHVRRLMDALKHILADSENVTDPALDAEEGSLRQTGSSQAASQNEAGAQSTTIQRIKQLNDEIWRTLKGVVDSVSRHTGGALPENASAVVRWQLMSVPRRWQRAVGKSANGNGSAGDLGPGAEPQSHEEAITSAHKMVAFAIEGLDMMEQVGGVVESTINSAESWLDTMGRKKKEPEDEEKGNAAPVSGEDTAVPTASTSATAEDGDTEMT